MTHIPVYEYKGRTKKDAEVSGTIEAPSRAVATVRLRKDGVWIESLQERGARPTRAARGDEQAGAPRRIHWSLFYGLRPVPPGALGNFFTQLAGLYKAGVGMQTIVEDTASRVSSPWLRAFLLGIAPRISAGEKLSDCLASYPQVFQAGVAGVVHAGEVTGNLDELARDLADDYLGEQRVWWLLMFPKIYFAVVLFLASLVPSFPWIIKKGFGWWVDHVIYDILPWMAAVVVAYLIVRVLWYLPPTLALRNRLAYYVPVWSILTRRIGLFRFYRCLELTVRAGVDFSTGMAVAAEAAGNTFLVRQLQQAAERVRTGVPLHEALEACPFIAPEALGSLSAAALGGTFDETLPGMAEQAKASRDMFVRILRTSAVAVAYGFTALVVIGVVVTAFLAIYKAQGIEKLLQ